MPAQAHEEEGHTHICTSPPAASCPGYDDEPQPGGTEIWSATMSTVSISNRRNRPLLYGWSSDGDYTGSTLTEDDFTFENEAYKIVEHLRRPRNTRHRHSTRTQQATFATQATRDKLVLHVGDASYYLETGTLASNQVGINWVTGLTWSAGENIELRLTTAPTAERLRLQDHLDGADDGQSRKSI